MFRFCQQPVDSASWFTGKRKQADSQLSVTGFTIRGLLQLDSFREGPTSRNSQNRAQLQGRGVLVSNISVNIDDAVASIQRRLNGNVVGYALAIGTPTSRPVKYCYGEARTAADPPSVDVQL